MKLRRKKTLHKGVQAQQFLPNLDDPDLVGLERLEGHDDLHRVPQRRLDQPAQCLIRVGCHLLREIAQHAGQGLFVNQKHTKRAQNKTQEIIQSEPGTPRRQQTQNCARMTHEQEDGKGEGGGGTPLRVRSPCTRGFNTVLYSILFPTVSVCVLALDT